MKSQIGQPVTASSSVSSWARVSASFFLCALPAWLQFGGGIFPNHVRFSSGSEQTLENLRRLFLRTAGEVGARGHDVGQIVGGDLPHTALADHRADHTVELIGDGLTLPLALACRVAGEPRRSVLPHERIRSDLFLRRPARAKLRDGEIALGDRPAVHVVVLPVRALDALPV